MNPLNWSAGPFLLLYSGLVVVTLLVLASWRGHIGRAGFQVSLEGLDAVELAYLAGGAARAADTLLVGLLEAGAVSAGRAGRLSANGSGALPGWARRHVADLHTALQRNRLMRYFANRRGALVMELAGRGLVPEEAEIKSYCMAAMSLLALTVTFGLAKAVIGAERGHPVGFLVCLVIFCTVAGLMIIFHAPYRSPAGGAALARFKRANARALRAPVADELLTAFALTGAAVLAGKAYQSFFVQAGSGGGSGCSGGGCGGGGCGGCS